MPQVYDPLNPFQEFAPEQMAATQPVGMQGSEVVTPNIKPTGFQESGMGVQQPQGALPILPLEIMNLLKIEGKKQEQKEEKPEELQQQQAPPQQVSQPVQPPIQPPVQPPQMPIQQAEPVSELPTQLDIQQETIIPPIQAQPAPMAEDGRITQRFGNPNPRLYGPGGYNRGVDISSDKGDVQTAPAEGNWVVESAYAGNGFNTGWGRSVLIKNTETGETIRRSHLDKVHVKKGDKVTGKALGTTGRTGRTTGSHQDIEYTNAQGRLTDYTKSPYFKRRQYGYR